MSAYSDAMLATSPVAYWRLGEASGTTAFDGSGNGHDGTYQNGPTLGQPGLIVDTDTAVLFDGVNDHVEVTQHADLKRAGEVSVEAWIKPSVLLDADVVRQGLGTDIQYSLFTQSAGRVGFQWNDGAFKSVESPSGTIAAGGTYHVVFTRDASLFVRGYVNGVQVASGQGTAPTGNPVAFRIAAASNTRFFPGLIDEVAVHNYPLTPEQVTALYGLGHFLRGPGLTRPARRYHRMGRGVTR